MSDHFSDELKGKLSKLVPSTTLFEKKRCSGGDSKAETLALDHMYTSITQNGEIDPVNPNGQSAESEVKFWKEWLILHLDLIQQQNDEILNKERTIVILQQENEMLKERISCMERGAPFHPKRNNVKSDFLDEGEDATPNCEDDKSCITLLSADCGTSKPDAGLSDGESQTENKFDSSDSVSCKVSDNFKTEIEVTDCKSVVVSVEDFDPMRNLRMNIRKKRLSNSSAISNNDSVLSEKRPFRKFKKRRKRVLKESQFLTSPEPYVTETNKNLPASTVPDISVDIPNNTTLEVPRWRIKVYASCYAMEGTENLDDEVYNKRHSRLENDERRRKRWDVQRIREQRIIEKLKQRQERIGSGSKLDEQNEQVQSLWPNPENVKYIEVCDQLPVSAFGCPIPKIAPSEFSLPWLSNPSTVVIKKVPARRSTVRRKVSKR